MAQAPSRTKTRTETRGTAAVAKAFFAAAAEIPEPDRPAVIKGAVARILSDLAAQKLKSAAAAKTRKAAAAAAKTRKAAAAPKRRARKPPVVPPSGNDAAAEA
ncbi:MAG: hypothetical protein ABSC06_38430 [Rhodopila sp.]|jgi:hypothetical protein